MTKPRLSTGQALLASSAGDKFMPPRGLGRSSCDGDAPVRPEIAGTWLELVAAPPSQVWTDRAREISKLREQGETLKSIGQRFGLSAERVRQILLDEARESHAPSESSRRTEDSLGALTDSAGATLYSSP